MKKHRRLWVLSLVCTMAACARPTLNLELDRFDRTAGYRFDNLESPDNSDELFVILTFSGGGTRAAALAYGVLEQLRETTVRVGETERSLLDEVDLISSISGGSFTSAYYGLFGERLFSDFRQDVLTNEIQDALIRGVLSPINWPRLLSGGRPKVILRVPTGSMKTREIVSLLSLVKPKYRG